MKINLEISGARLIIVTLIVLAVIGIVTGSHVPMAPIDPGHPYTQIAGLDLTHVLEGGSDASTFTDFTFLGGGLVVGGTTFTEGTIRTNNAVLAVGRICANAGTASEVCLSEEIELDMSDAILTVTEECDKLPGVNYVTCIADCPVGRTPLIGYCSITSESIPATVDMILMRNGQVGNSWQCFYKEVDGAPGKYDLKIESNVLCIK